MSPRIYFTCTACGSMNLLWDAYVQWNIQEQRNEEAGGFDSAHCNNCEGETSVDGHIIADDDWLFSVEFVSSDGKGALEETVIAKTAEHAVQQAINILSTPCACSQRLVDYDTIKIHCMEIRDERKSRTPADAAAD